MVVSTQFFWNMNLVVFGFAYMKHLRKLWEKSFVSLM